MKKLLLISFFFLFFAVAFAQNPLVKQWDKRYGGTDIDQLNYFQSTNDGGFLFIGYSYSGIGGDKTQPLWGVFDWDYWIVKTDSLGNKQWDKNFGGTAADELYSSQQTKDGGYILGGYSRSGIGGDKTQPIWGQGSHDYWVLKIDSLGNKQWDKDFGGTSEDFLYSVQQTNDDGYILGGWSKSPLSGDKSDSSRGGYDYWIVKVDSLGNKQWDKTFGGYDQDILYSLQMTSDGGFILGGSSYSGLGGDKSQPSWGNADYWILKIDSLGNKLWDKDFGGNNIDMLYSLVETTDFGFLLAGVSTSGISGNKTQPNWDTLCNPGCTFDYWIVKTDSLGNKQWDKDYGGTSSEDECNSILTTVDGGYLIGGASYSQMSGDKTENNLGIEQSWIIKLDSLGVKQWDKTIFTYGHHEHGFIAQSGDGCFVIANFGDGGIGGYKTQPSQGTADYWHVKFCDSTLTSTSNINQQTSNFTIFPNPANEEVTVNLNYLISQSPITLIIYDAFGREVLSQQVTTQNQKLQTSNIPSGIYIIKAFPSQGIFQRKLIVNH